MKFEGSGSKGTRVIERKRSVTDGRTDGQTARRIDGQGKNNMSPPEGGRHNNKVSGQTQFAARSCCDLGLQGTVQLACFLPKTLAHCVYFSKIAVVTTVFFHLTLHATEILHNTLYQYGDHSCEIVVKFDFKSQSYGPETILLKGHAVTLTFKVAAQMLQATCRLNMVIISVKLFQNLTSNNKVMDPT